MTLSCICQLFGNRFGSSCVGPVMCLFVCDCVRWLLLDFKREFPLEQSIRLFEVLSSHYLELNSDRAMVEADKVIASEFEREGVVKLIIEGGSN